MTKFPAKTLAVVALLSACTRPSPDTNALEVELVPQLIEWSKVGGEFDLAKSLPEGAYDKVCVVSEYSSLNSLEKQGRVDEYHSAFGMSVPEGSAALVVIGSNKVHAALVDGAKLRFSGPFGAECVTATRAVLRSNFEPHLKVQTADLFEK
jgi:hypothetical protein